MKSRYFLILCFLAFLLAGCASPHVEKEPVENVRHLTVGHSLKVENTDDRFVLVDDNSTLAADGLYYASWGMGDPEPYENSNGDMADLYDASLYLLVGEAKSQEAARKYMDTWLEAANTGYDVSEQKEMTYHKQLYTIVTYHCNSEDNPYDQGISAFGTFGNNAVCVELTCMKDFKDDPETILANFLDNCSYITDN